MITLTRKQIIIMKNITALIVLILSAITIINGFGLLLTAELFNGLYAVIKLILGTIGVIIGLGLKYGISIAK